MDFISLPVEIIVLIFSFLSPKHIKEARLVCKAFCWYSSQYLIDTVFAGSQTNTLQRLEEIATHDIFRKTVTTVVYSTCSLSRNYATVDEYYEHLQELQEHPLRSKDTIPTKEQCEVYWGKYRELYDDQVRVLRDGSDKTRITMALQSMPNVKHLVLSCAAWESPAHPLYAVWDAGSDFVIKPGHDPDKGPWLLSHGFEVMSSAFIANKIRPESLMQIEPKYTYDVLRSNCFTKELQQFFIPLYKISLIFNEQRIAYLDMVKNCLFAARRLEYLRVEVGTLERRTAFTALLDNSWPNLTSVSLEFDFDYEVFVAFCRKNKSLRFLHLKTCGLFGGTWAELVPIMRECFHLTDARIEGLSERNGEYAWTRANKEIDSYLRLPEAEHYLVHGGENPFRSGVLELEDVRYL
jgi:hypothetical protein